MQQQNPTNHQNTVGTRDIANEMRANERADDDDDETSDQEDLRLLQEAIDKENRNGNRKKLKDAEPTTVEGYQ